MGSKEKELGHTVVFNSYDEELVGIRLSPKKTEQQCHEMSVAE